MSDTGECPYHGKDDICGVDHQTLCYRSHSYSSCDLYSEAQENEQMTYLFLFGGKESKDHAK